MIREHAKNRMLKRYGGTFIPTVMFYFSKHVGYSSIGQEFRRIGKFKYFYDGEKITTFMYGSGAFQRKREIARRNKQTN